MNQKANTTEPQKPRRRWFQFRLRTLLIVVMVLAIPCGYLGWQAKIARERHAVFALLESRGGLWRSPPNLMFPGPVQSVLSEALGDLPPQKYIFLGDDQRFTEAEIHRIKQVFPEAEKVKIIPRCIDDGASNCAEPWPTEEQNQRCAADPAWK